MSELTERLTEDLKEAMRAKDKARLRTLRSLRAALRDREIEIGADVEEGLSAEDELKVLQKQAKQRREAIEQYESADRTDLLEKEKEELEIVEEYLPRQLTDEEIDAVVDEAIRTTDSSSMADMGQVMGAVMGELRGRADGNRVRKIVARKLSD
jgi:uncharacterized protein YqeY